MRSAKFVSLCRTQRTLHRRSCECRTRTCAGAAPHEQAITTFSSQPLPGFEMPDSRAEHSIDRFSQLNAYGFRTGTRHHLKCSSVQTCDFAVFSNRQPQTLLGQEACQFTLDHFADAIALARCESV